MASCQVSSFSKLKFERLKLSNGVLLASQPSTINSQLCQRLRVKDVDFARNQIVIHEGKGMKDRVTMLPDRLKAELQTHLQSVRRTWQEDVAAGHGKVWLPGALRMKYPGAERAW